MRKVLIVDDSKLNLKILERILSPDYEVLTADDGAQALKILEECHHLISAVLSDLLMPVMDGYALLSAIKKDSRFSSIPVIVTSGSGQEGDEAKALSMGAFAYTLKPYHAELLKEKLCNAIKLFGNVMPECL